MPRRPSPIPPALPRPVFTASEARAVGVSTDRLRAQDIRRLAYGLYAVADVDLSERAVLTAITRTDPDAVVSGFSAARLLGLPLPSWVAPPRPAAGGSSAPKAGYILSAGADSGLPRASTPSPTYVATAEPGAPMLHLTSQRTRRDHSFIRWREQTLPAEQILTVGDLRLTDRVRTWLDLGTELRREELVAVADHLVRRPRSWAENRSDPYATLEQLAEAVEEHPGRGRPRLREALALSRVGADSAAETTARLALGRAGIPEAELNREIVEDGVGLGEPDLSWPRWRVCLEYDGAHHRRREQHRFDIRRREQRERHGWIEVQAMADDLADGFRSTVRRLERALREHGWSRDG
ncbi:hypothetical protein [Brachybacterium sp. J153]|uniref:hypothetical protein n=1 Tax=Brachybacterium sp. J153 TaxID=3116488 RepID=UPI002E79D80B|nr:hypothetical protein [Brachybacterium sp. J153]MEE1617804.1 hypothetical protein [Brachybacterium sp. J153]